MTYPKKSQNIPNLPELVLNLFMCIKIYENMLQNNFSPRKELYIFKNLKEKQNMRQKKRILQYNLNMFTFSTVSCGYTLFAVTLVASRPPVSHKKIVRAHFDEFGMNNSNPHSPCLPALVNILQS